MLLVSGAFDYTWFMHMIPKSEFDAEFERTLRNLRRVRRLKENMGDHIN